MKKLLGFLAVALLFAGLLTACGSSSGGSSAAGVTATATATATTVETTGTSGAWTINMSGGKGGTGGSGGYWYMETYQAQGVKIARAGTAATSFSVPNYNPPVELGTNACTASANATVVVKAAGAGTEPALGVLYMVGGQNYLYKSAGSGAVTFPVVAEQCTGLKVNSGVKLTVGLNYDTDSNGAYDLAYLYFPSGDVAIDGTLQTADLTTSIIGTPDTRHTAAGTARDMGALYIEAQQVFVHATGSILARGLNGAAGQRGGDGGLIYVYAYNFFINQGTIDNSGGSGFDLTASSTTIGGDAGVSSSWGNYTEIYVDKNTGPSSGGGGVFVNTGKITTNGGKGSTGGETSEIYIYAYSDVFNKGPMSANAGAGTNGPGGSGNWDIYIYSEYASIYNSGALSQTGGNGTTGGGTGGYIYLTAGNSGYSGDIVNSGSITADAGSATVSGTSGGRPYIYLYAYGAIKTSGKISANGGDSMGTNTGGTGGYLYLENYTPYDYGYGEDLSVRPIQVSGNIYLNGGVSVAGTGGDGGAFYIYQDSSGSALSNTGIQLLGYASANLSGGFGTTTAGGAPYGSGSWSMEVYTYNDYSGYGYTPTPPGPIVNQINIIAKGGNSNGTGGGGNYGIDWETYDTYFGTGGVSTITNSGTLDTSGGNGGTGNGGDSGEIYLYGHDGVKNSGSVFAKGGNSTNGNGGTGAYGGVWIYSSMNIVNSGAINTTGGSGVSGGNGSRWSSTPFTEYVQISAGGKVTNTGGITCAGGAATSGANGNGGGIDILSEVGGTKNTGALNVTAGAGAGAPGLKGQAWIDWVQVK